METDKNKSLRRKKFLEDTRELTDSLQQSNKLLTEASERLSREITERKQTEELLKILTENSPVGIYIVQNKKFVFVNPQFQKITGFSEEELLEMDPLEIVHPEDRDNVKEQSVQMLKGISDTPYEFRFTNKYGETRWSLETTTSITYKGERASLGNFMDITQRKKNESELFLRAQLLDKASDAINLHDLDANIIYVNEQYCKSHGYSKEEVTGKNMRQLSTPLPEERIQALNKILEDTGSATFESAQTRKDGSVMYIEVSSRIIESGGQKFVLSIERDITERKRIEAALQENEAFTTSLLENSPHQINVINPDTSIRYVNPTFVKANGWTLEELVGIKAPYPWWPEGTEDDLLPRFKKSMESDGGHADVQTRKKNGELYWIEFDWSPIKQNGELKYMLLNAMDITRRKEAEKQIEELLSQETTLRQSLEEEMEWRVDFTRALVHELKTPLTPILAAGEMLHDEVHEEPLLKLIENIRRSASTMSTRIDTLLDLARGEMGMLELDYSQVDVLKLLHQVYDEMIPMAKRQKITIVPEFPSSLPLIWADEGRLEQVLTNLLTNAFKWSPDNSKVIFRARKKDDNLLVEVQDSGPGIANENQDKIFEAYYRVQSNTPRIGGLGLGLALCKTIIDCHNGTIGVESEEGKGSTFFFTIPLQAGDK
ncbi:PAS domain S-box protein [Chloroflexota bacterium]